HTRFSRDWSSDVCSSDLHRTRRLETVGQHLSAILDHIDDLICIEDEDRRCRYANRPFREFFGLPDMAPEAADPGYHPDAIRANGIAAADLPALRRGERIVAEQQRPSARPGRTHTFQSINMPLRGPDGATGM